VRYSLTGRLPAITRVLLIESGRREILERLIPALRRIWGDAVQLDLLTCYPGLPAGSALTGDIGSRTAVRAVCEEAVNRPKEEDW
jgi:hypothetical protein